MNYQEVKVLEQRLKKYRDLEAARAEVQMALDVMDQKGEFHAPPFTGNTRESRRVLGLTIRLSATQGGEKPTEVELRDLGVSAWLFGDNLKQQLREKLELIDKEMEKI